MYLPSSQHPAASHLVPLHTVSPTAALTRWLVRWMVASAAVVVLTLVVGGATRLTESGLSITEWKPVAGVLPPMSAASWDAAYQAYLQIPEAQTVHRGITLAEFKSLFWWEWAHRIVARLAGLVLALPWLWLVVRRKLDRVWIRRLAILPLLTAAQGALGWYMVSSGLSERTDVSQYRLVAHLGLALVIFVLAVRYALLLRGAPAFRWNAPHAVAALSFLTILSGGFVAGLDAGHIFNTFPLMGVGLVPPGYLQLSPAWRNLFDNPAAVQFNHRVLAIATLVVALLVARRLGARQGWLLGAAALLQVTLGISTLLMGVPLLVAGLHQLGAVLLLTAAIVAGAGTLNPPAPLPATTDRVQAAA